jgi:hypothetical protein
MDKTLTDAVLVANEAGLTDRALAAVVEAATAAKLAEADRPGLVALVHPDLPDRLQLVDPEAVPIYQRSGWSPTRAELDAAADMSPDAAPDDEAEAVTVKATKTKTPAKKETS